MTFCITELTPPGSGSVTVLRLTGQDAERAALSLASCGLPDVGSFRWTRLRIGDEILDEALLCAPAAGELELHIHGSPALVRRLREHWRSPEGAVSEGGHRDPAGSIEERALRAAASAPSEAAARMLIDQADGALRAALTGLCELTRERREEALAVLLERGRIARFTMRPTKVALAGPVNAGKSTLFNVLVGERRVVVSDQPGTTRDVVRAEIMLGAYPALLSDSAGERSVAGDAPSAELERAAQQRASSERRDADLVLWLQAADDAREVTPRTAKTAQASARLRSCADRVSAGISNGATLAQAESISAQGLPEHARNIVERVLLASFRLPAEPWVAGAAVPFESDQVAVLARVAESSTDAGVHALLRSLLEPAGSDAGAASVAPRRRVH